MKNLKEKISLALLGVIYALCSIRYFPNQPGKTGIETAIHIFSVAPLSIGTTIIVFSIFKKITGDKIPIDRLVRIFLVIAITLEFILGLYHYLRINTQR